MSITSILSSCRAASIPFCPSSNKYHPVAVERDIILKIGDATPITKPVKMDPDLKWQDLKPLFPHSQGSNDSLLSADQTKFPPNEQNRSIWSTT
jgi:hypothetical protein